MAATTVATKMSLLRTNSQQSFKPIPEDTDTHTQTPDNITTLQSPENSTRHSLDPATLPPRAPHSSPAAQDGSCTPETQIKELRKLLTDWQDDKGAGGVGGRGGGISVSGSGGGSSGSRPSSRCSLRSSSRQGSRFGSRRSSWVNSEDEDEETQVTSSQKAHLLVASQQRLLYTLQGLRHELSSLDEEVNRVRNDMLNSRRFFNAMRGVQEQATWGSSSSSGGGSLRRICTTPNAGKYPLAGSGSSSPSMYSLDNSYSDDADSLARSESSSSFASWRSEAELSNVFRDAEDAADKTSSGKSSNNSSISITQRSDTTTTTTYNNSSHDSSSSSGYNSSQNSVHKDNSSNSNNSGNNSGASLIRGRYRQLTPSRR